MIDFVVADVVVARIGLSILLRTHKMRTMSILAVVVVTVAVEATKMKTTMMMI